MQCHYVIVYSLVLYFILNCQKCTTSVSGYCTWGPDSANLQAQLAASESRATEAEKNLAQAKIESEEILKRAEKAETKINETQEALQRFVL